MCLTSSESCWQAVPLLLVALSRSGVTPFSSSWIRRLEKRYTGVLQRATLHHRDQLHVCVRDVCRCACVSGSPVPVHHPPDGKDGGNDGYQDDDACPRAHQDQHQPLALGNTQSRRYKAKI